MAIYLKWFKTDSEYNTYAADTENFIIPNVSYIENSSSKKVRFTPSESGSGSGSGGNNELICTYNVHQYETDYSIHLFSEYVSSSLLNSIESMEIDGAVQSEVVYDYVFDTAGSHTVKYIFADEPISDFNAVFKENSNIISVVIPNVITAIGDYAFGYCRSLTSVTIPNSVTSIGDYAFSVCTSLTSIDIPNGVTSIGNQALYMCSGLTSCNIGSGVTSIGNSAFGYCTSLTNITIPNSVTSIGDTAFYVCSGLTSITSNATTAPTIGSYTFQHIKTGGTLRVPSGSSGYCEWMDASVEYSLGYYNWTTDPTIECGGSSSGSGSGNG